MLILIVNKGGSDLNMQIMITQGEQTLGNTSNKTTQETAPTEDGIL